MRAAKHSAYFYYLKGDSVFGCSVAAFVVNSEPHAGARPSVRLCVGLELARCVHYAVMHFPCFLLLVLLKGGSGSAKTEEDMEGAMRDLLICEVWALSNKNGHGIL